MTTKLNLQEALKSSMKERNSAKSNTIRGILTELQYEEINGTVTDESATILAVLTRTVKKLREELEFAEKAGKTEDVQKVHAEIALAETFLPKQLSEDELLNAMKDIFNQAPEKNIGAIMKGLKEKYTGQYDSKLASQLAAKVLKG